MVSSKWLSQTLYYVSLNITVATRQKKTNHFTLILFRVHVQNMGFADGTNARPIDENNPENSRLTSVQVIRPSLDINYFITEGNDEDYFEINRSSGEIIIKGKS